MGGGGMEGDRLVEEALGRALGILANECSPSTTSTSSSSTSTPRTYFSPVLTSGAAPLVGGASPPLALIGSISCWVLEELENLDTSHKCIASLASTPTTIQSLGLSSLRALRCTD